MAIFTLNRSLTRLGCALLLTVPGRLQAQLPAAAQSIALAPKGALGGTVQLANRTTVLLLGDAESADVKAVALRPDGTTVWTANLVKLQQLPTESRVVMSADIARTVNSRLSFIQPMDVYVCQDDIYTAEEVSSKALAKAGKEFAQQNGLKANQLLLQHLDPQGQVTKASVQPPEFPNRVDRNLIGQFGDGGAFYRFYEEVDGRAETRVHLFERYDLKTRTATRVVLPLAPTPERKSMNIFYNRWTYLGHRPNQTYFARRLASPAKNVVPLSVPMQYEVVITDNDGKQTGGFSTTLDLKDGYPAYSGYMPLAVGEDYTTETYQAGRVIYDAFRNTMGGMGDFYLDYATGDVVIFGEYRAKKADRMNLYSGRLLGFFLQRYAPDGTLRQSGQVPYPADKAKKDEFEIDQRRVCNFSWNAVAQHYEYTFCIVGMFSSKTTLYTLVVDSNLKLVRLNPSEWERPPLNPDKVVPQPLVITGPICGEKFHGRAFEVREYAQFGPQEPPVFAKLAAARAEAQKADPAAVYYLSSTDNAGHALLIEHRQKQGGSVNVYAF